MWTKKHTLTDYVCGFWVWSSSEVEVRVGTVEHWFFFFKFSYVPSSCCELELELVDGDDLKEDIQKSFDSYLSS